jgi:hypothetical protein
VSHHTLHLPNCCNNIFHFNLHDSHYHKPSTYLPWHNCNMITNLLIHICIQVALKTYSYEHPCHHEVLFLKLPWNQQLTQTSCAIAKLYKLYKSCLPPNWMNIIWMVTMTHHCNIEKKKFLPTLGGRNQCWLVIDFFQYSASWLFIEFSFWFTTQGIEKKNSNFWDLLGINIAAKLVNPVISVT